MRFTGHERDLADPASDQDVLDYMHARHYSMLTGRFLSVDLAGGHLGQPQSWNRYSYARGNPVGFVDPNGFDPLPANQLAFFNALFSADFSEVDVQKGMVAAALTGVADAGAVTLGSNIYLSSQSSKNQEAGMESTVRLFGHELTHVLQYRHLGTKRFLDGYLEEYSHYRRQGLSHRQSYENIIVEDIAFQVENVLGDFLKSNPEIATKLTSGLDLSQKELSLVSQALDEASKRGDFKKGYRFIQGFLVYVQTPPPK